MRFRSSAVVALAATVAVVALAGPVGAAPARSRAVGGDGPGFIELSTTAPPTPRAGAPDPWVPLPAPPSDADPQGPAPEVDDPEGASAGALDFTFSADGRVAPNFVPGAEDGAATLVQPNGRIVVAGAAGGRIQLARFNANGTPDTTFSADGAVQTDLTSGTDWVEDIAIQPSGKLLVVGSAGGTSFVARYTTNGTLDSSFGQAGLVGLRVGNGFNFASSVGLDGNGRIVFAGRGGGNGGRVVVARISAAGVPDSSWSGDGIAVTDFRPGDDWAWDLAIVPGNKVVVAGATEGTTFAMAVARFTANGALDGTFGNAGRRSLSFAEGDDIATGVAVLGDGRVVVAGAASSHGGEMAVARLSPGGTFDTSFSIDGWASVDFTNGLDYPWDVVAPGDGTLVLAGRAVGQGGQFAVARLSDVGALDPTFSGDGRATANLTSGDDVGHAVAIGGDGKIVVSGGADVTSANGRIGLARFQST